MNIINESITINKSLINSKNDENLSEILNIQRFPNIYPLIGFDFPSFSNNDSNLICISDCFLTQIDLDNCLDKKIYYNFNAQITALLISHNYRLIALCLNHEKHGEVIVIKDTQNFKTITSFSVK